MERDMKRDMGIKEVNSFYDVPDKSKSLPVNKLTGDNYNSNQIKNKSKNNHKHKLTYRKLCNIINKSLNSEL